MSDVPIKEPDEMGVWTEDGDVVWLPQSLYAKRWDAIRWAMRNWGVTLPEVRCRVGYLRYTPHVVGPFAFEGFTDPGYSDDYWTECEAGEPGAFRVWRLESA